MKCHGLVRLLYVVVLLARPVNAVEANATSAENEETLAAPETPCPVPCICTAELEVDCSSVSLQRLPQDLTEQLLKLDLSRNNISMIPDEAFLQLEYLVELNLAGNQLRSLSDYVFQGLKRLKELSLQDNSLTAVPWEAMEPLESLEILRLDGNRISNISSSVFTNISHLHNLWLGRNQLTRVPTLALSSLENLKALDLGGNNIAEIEDRAFLNLTNLELLILKGNKISNISDNAFQGLNRLQILEINENRLTKVPAAIQSLANLQELTIASNIIRSIDDNTFHRNRALTLIEMKGNPLQVIGHNAFANMPQLKKLFISEVKTLSLFPNLNGSETLEFLHIDRTSLSYIPNDLCRVLKKLKSIFVLNNQITVIPNLTECHNLLSLDISINQIQEIGSSSFETLTQLHDVNLAFNQIESIPVDAFLGLETLKILNLANNKIKYIHPDAFLPLKKLDDLNLGNNQFPTLPALGLENVRTLDTSGNIYLKEFPSPSSFPHIKSLILSYAYHCCEFLPLAEGGSAPVLTDEIILWPSEDKKVDMRMWNNTDLWPAFENLTSRFGEFAEEIWGNFGPDYTYPYNFPQYIEDYLEEDKNQQRADGHKERHPVHCLPQPGPFMPCEDLFDWWTLRCGIWIVFLLAMLGNGTVVFVLVFSRSKMDVPRFLVCNLAVSDFFMGIYLGFLAVVDASTLGQFKMHAIGWQTSSACQIAGFLGVLSSELSVYTLAVITMERNYAITHAMHLNKRLSIKQAAYIMACGWAFALIMASLPVFGISDYSKFAVCLPFEIRDSWSLAYVVFLMSVNGVAFLILMGCYLKMYCAIRGSQAWNSNDSRIAKRMALLVFTDFICWAPIAFFSLTAAFGLQLISLEEAKVFTIFVLPLNSCANPFLYAILTKQFKKDCVLICKAIEESRVTRGIGRCRHSSNFSNRQTPANTNSVIDRNSSNNGQVCSCNLKSGDSDKPMPKPWRLSKVRYLLCDAGETEQDSSNDYAYTLADIQRSQQKHKRNSSVSSENFSSSRSDSWRNRSIPLRLLDRHRRNSWTITRKSSQDSNLSNSRNDSSATTASTSTWRISRSSVSSDSSATRSGVYPTKPAGATVTMPNSGPEQRYPSFRQKDHGNQVPNPIPNRALPPTAVRPRPKLTRQVAISDESWAVAHGTQEEPRTEDNVYLPPPPQTVVPERVEGGPQGQLSVGFVPRKLSTISSRSCSINRENSCGPGGTLSIEDPLQRLARTADNQPSSSSEDEVFDSSLPERNRLLLQQNEPPRSDSAKETQPLVNSES